MIVHLTNAQIAALSLDDVAVCAMYGISRIRARCYDGPWSAWQEVLDAANHFATDWASDNWNDPMAASLRGLARKLKRAIGRPVVHRARKDLELATADAARPRLRYVLGQITESGCVVQQSDSDVHTFAHPDGTRAVVTSFGHVTVYG